MGIKPLIQTMLHEKNALTWKVIFWANGILLLYLTLMPSVQQTVSIPNIDKVFHFIGFGAFAFFCVLAFPKLKPWIVVVISTLLGVLVEIVQSFIPYRGFSVADMLADFLGIIVAISFIHLVRKQLATE